MKRTICILGTLLMLLLCMCRKDKGLCELTAAPDLKIAYSSGAVFTVNPSGGDDTRALTDAFEDAKAAGPGSR